MFLLALSSSFFLGLPSSRGFGPQEVPCAVCSRKQARGKGLMIPGTVQCPTGFTPDYSGFLFAPSTGYSRGQVR